MPPWQPEIVQPGPRCNAVWFCAALAAMAARRLRHPFGGHGRPRDFPTGDAARSADYDLSVFDGWLRALEAYLGGPVSLSGRAVLELGPGGDLGTGLIARALGAERYVGFDAFPLAGPAAEPVHRDLLPRLAARGLPAGAELLTEASAALAGRGGRLRYVVRRDFDLSAADLGPADLVLSQAAFEHFDRPERTIEQLARLASPGALFLALIDLQTHTRWLRDRDPLSVYRCPEWLYARLRVAGAPNRVRPAEYVEWLKQAGWRDVRVLPTRALAGPYLTGALPHLARRFRDPRAGMQDLCVFVAAVKA